MVFDCSYNTVNVSMRIIRIFFVSVLKLSQYFKVYVRNSDNSSNSVFHTCFTVSAFSNGGIESTDSNL